MAGFLSDKIIAPLIVFLLGTLIVMAVSQYTGKWLGAFEPVPNWFSAAILLALILACAVILRFSQIKKRDSPLMWTLPSAPYGWQPFGQAEYAGVLWDVRIPRNLEKALPYDRRIDYSILDYPDIVADNLDVGTPPKCPKCKTEIEEESRFFGGYTWKCARCGFHKKNKDSYDREADRVLTIARRETLIRLEAERKKEQAKPKSLTIQEAALENVLKRVGSKVPNDAGEEEGENNV